MWLLEKTIKIAIETAEKAGYAPSLEVRDMLNAQFGADSPGGHRLISPGGVINIVGTLTKSPSFLAMLFGGGNTTYAEISDAIQTVDNDPGVERITLNIDSPGGHFDGMFSAMESIQLAKKPVTANLINLTASAAYGLASQADEIVAENKSTRVGSVGVAVDAYIDENEISLSSTEAPEKRPDLKTKEGKDVVIKELDNLHNLFVGAIADGRGVTAEKVNTDFGRGGMLLAEQALTAGMIDSVGGINKQPATPGEPEKEIKSMDLTTLKAEHRAVFDAVKAEGKTEGQTQERDRVVSHLIMGNSVSGMKTAIEAIKTGEGMTETLLATYRTAEKAEADINDRLVDEKKTLKAGQADKKDEEGGESVADLVEAGLGISAQA